MSDSSKRRRIIEDDEDDQGFSLTVDASQAQEIQEDGNMSNPDEYIENDAISEEEGEDLDENWLE